MKSFIVLLLALSFSLVGCSSSDKMAGSKSKASKKMAVEGQLPDHDYEIYQPAQSEIMVIIDSRGKAKEIPNEWDVDTSGHMAYTTGKPVKMKKSKRMPASVKKKKKKRSKKKKRKKRSKKKKR